MSQPIQQERAAQKLHLARLTLDVEHKYRGPQTPGPLG